MADFTEALFRIDPTQGLVDYVNTVKPYHTKVLDILVEYVYTEAVDVRINETWTWCMEFTRPGGWFSGMCTDGIPRTVPGGDIEYSCGYGYLWDPHGLESPESNPTSRIITAIGKLLIDVTTTAGSSSIDIIRNVSGHSLAINDPIVFQNIPLSLYTPPTYTCVGEVCTVDDPGFEYISPGATYYITSTTPTTLEVSDSIGGLPVVIGGNATLQILPQNLHYNSFLVEPTLDTSVYNCLVANVNSNKVSFVDEYDITGVNPTLKQWNFAVGTWVAGSGYTTGTHTGITLLTQSGTGVGAVATIVVNSIGQVNEVVITSVGSGYTTGSTLIPLGGIGPGVGFVFTVSIPELTLPLSEDDLIYINGNSTAISNGSYTVDSVQGSVVQVKENIPPLTNSTGSMYITDIFNTIPFWPAGLKVKVNNIGGLPGPLVDGGVYYFNPTTTMGVFNLTTTRYPQEFTDFVDLTTVGNMFTIERAEPFTPGDNVNIFGTQNDANNGFYTISTVDSEGSNFRIGVMQNVPRTTPTPSPSTYDGAMSLSQGSYDMPTTCPAIKTPDLYTSTYIDENLQFTFHITEADFIGVALSENTPSGWGTVPFGPMPSYGLGIPPLYPYTVMTEGIPTAGTQLVLPTGFDTQLFDVGAIDETLNTTLHLHGRSFTP